MDRSLSKVACRHILGGLALLLFILPNKIAVATESLQLLNTITIDRDSIRIGSVDPVGDFNNDGYDDMAITFYDPRPHRKYEAVYLYYGGPNFDTHPDLIFHGDTSGCCPGENITGFGYPVGLKDFNGDGFNDLAISAAVYCRGWYTGRIYIYFGSQNPDTIADMIIDGNMAADRLGCALAGDYNGDSYGDLIAVASNEEYGDKIFIYLGGNLPDTIPAWSYSYDEQRIEGLKGNSDINDDGYDDFGWGVSIDTFHQYYIFLGNNTLDQMGADTLIDTGVMFPGDISGDSIDDIAVWENQDPFQRGMYLCLGGAPLDLNPDYYMWDYYNKYFIYHQHNLSTKLIRNDDFAHQLISYNTGVPFDTIPTSIFPYGHQYWPLLIANIGDINADGNDEIAMIDTNSTYVDIYSIVTTGIEEHDANLPLNHTLITCYPNPFNSSTIISINGLNQKGGEISLEIYNLLGQLVNRLPVSVNDNGQLSRVIWDAKDVTGKSVTNGLYFVRLTTRDRQVTTKVIFEIV